MTGRRRDVSGRLHRSEQFALAYPVAAWLTWAAVFDFGHGWLPITASALACAAASLLVPIAHLMERVTPNGLVATYTVAMAVCFFIGLAFAILAVPLALLPLGVAYGFAFHAADSNRAASRGAPGGPGP